MPDRYSHWSASMLRQDQPMLGRFSGPVKYFSDKELIAGPSSERNWKGLLLALLVIVVVCSLVGLSAWILQPDEENLQYDYQYDFDAMFDSSWKPHVVKGTWKKDVFIYQDKMSNIIQIKDGKFSVLINNSTYTSLGTYKYTVSTDLKFALLAFEPIKLFRHSFKAKYHILNIATKQHVSLSENYLDYADWGNSENDIVYVKDGNIYYKQNTGGDAVQITDSANANFKNGITDWVYEEEVFSSYKAHWVSPMSTLLAYASFNDSKVSSIDVTVYKNDIYPKKEWIKYPKSGYSNPDVTFHVYHFETRSTIAIKSTIKTPPILNSLSWLSDKTFLVTWSNRYQNESETSKCDVILKDGSVSSQCAVVHKRQYPGWIQYLNTAPVGGDEGEYFLIEESYHGGMGNFYHINKVDFNNEEKTSNSFITSGNFEVTEIVKYDGNNKLLYYISNEPSPGDRQLYSVNTNTMVRRCVSCQINCSYVSASLSYSNDYALVQCKGSHVPFTALINLKNKETYEVENNKELVNKVANTYLPRIVYESIPIKVENEVFDLPAKLYFPANFADMKLPLLVSVYGGPGSQKVSSQFRLDWTSYLVTYHNVAVVEFDGRGSGFKGAKILKSINRRLGTYEIEDQITAVEYLLKKHKYLDEERVGIWGWSYGGYASAMVATHQQSIAKKLFKCAISVAPVTNWLYYDSIYTERYMGAPDHNVKGYNEASLTTRAELFKHLKYLLVQGTADDNVHYQNTAMLEKALVQAQVQYQMQVYADQAHSLSSDSTQRHLYRLMTNFLLDCYGDGQD